MRRLLPLALLLTVSSCAMLDEMVTVLNPDTGQAEQVRVGDLAADAVDRYTGPAANILTTLTSTSPVIGAGIGAALLAAAGAASSRLRKKKPQAPENV